MEQLDPKPHFLNASEIKSKNTIGAMVIAIAAQVFSACGGEESGFKFDVNCPNPSRICDIHTGEDTGTTYCFIDEGPQPMESIRDYHKRKGIIDLHTVGPSDVTDTSSISGVCDDDENLTVCSNEES